MAAVGEPAAGSVMDVMCDGCVWYAMYVVYVWAVGCIWISCMVWACVCTVYGFLVWYGVMCTVYGFLVWNVLVIEYSHPHGRHRHFERGRT